MSRGTPIRPSSSKSIRCAIYTRKSSEEGLDQDFNSLDAQREAGEAYIVSQKAEGWTCLPDKYDDGGYSGGNTERPALQRLMKDIESGKVDVLVVYKIDRLSRSLMDFAKLMEVFERRNISFVSVTQRFSTADSMGRLMLNVLLSFAQFEREIIGERIRDKVAAQRRKGKWAGGTPVLGYDVDRPIGGPRLVVNPTEAARVRKIFEKYLELGSLLPVVQDLTRLGWTNKAYRTGKGKIKGGQPFDRCKLYTLLTNPIYTGKIRHKEQVFAGEHEAIVPQDVFARVQAQLQQHGRSGGADLRNKYGALLRGLLYCKGCDRSMTHVFTGRGNKRYRYYTCTGAIKKGHGTCLTKSLPAAEVERAVVDQIRVIASDPDLLQETLKAARGQSEATLAQLQGERAGLDRGLTRLQGEIRRIATAAPATADGTARIADLHDQARRADERLAAIDLELKTLRDEMVSEDDLTAAFRDFDNVWNALSPKEQAEVLRLLIHKVEFDAAESDLVVTFHESGIKGLGGRLVENAA